MEPIETNEQQQPAEENNLILLEDAQYYLVEAGKWSRFLGIVGYIMTSLMAFGIVGLLIALSIGKSGGRFPGGFSEGILLIFYAPFVVLNFYISRYLYQFGSQVKEAIHYQDSVMISSSMSKLKSLFKILGILTIVVIALYAIIIVGMIIGGVLGAAMMR